MPTYSQLVYRGNFEVSVGVDYSDSHLDADFGGGLSETDVVFPGLLNARLNYSALSRDAMIQLPSGQAVDRLMYVWLFYREHMDAGNRPFLMRSPLDKKLYLWKFADKGLTISLIDLFMGTTGMSLKQTSVRGVSVNADGSIPEGVTV